MKFVTVRDLRTSPAKVWKALPVEQELILTNNGKPIALITPLNESDLEETLKSVRRARAQTAVRMMQLSAQKNGLNLSESDIADEMRTVRDQREKS